MRRIATFQIEPLPIRRGCHDPAADYAIFDAAVCFRFLLFDAAAAISFDDYFCRQPPLRRRHFYQMMPFIC